MFESNQTWGREQTSDVGNNVGPIWEPFKPSPRLCLQYATVVADLYSGDDQKETLDR